MYRKDKFYTPTALEAFLFPFCIIVFGALLHLGQIRDRYFSTIRPSESLGTSTLGRMLDNEIVNSAGVFIFWVIVGTIGYAFVVFAAMVGRAYRSDQPMQNYIQTAADKQNVMARYALRSVALTSGIAWLAFTLSYGLGWIDTQISKFIWNGDIIAAMLALTVGSCLLFVPIILVRLFVLRTRVFTR